MLAYIAAAFLIAVFILVPGIKLAMYLYNHEA